MHGSKKCRKCGEDKSLGQFYIRKRSSDGYQSWCKECDKTDRKDAYWRDPKASNENSRSRHAERRLKVLRHYGGDKPSCKCCGASYLRHLAVDHIDNDGSTHRRSIGGSANIVRWIIANKFPPGFQVLCHNCNCAKGFYGSCDCQAA